MGSRQAMGESRIHGRAFVSVYMRYLCLAFVYPSSSGPIGFWGYGELLIALVRVHLCVVLAVLLVHPWLSLGVL